MTRGIAVVTGASSGIGAASARALAAEGFEVVCVARRAERIEALAQEIGGRAVTCDVTDEAAVAALAETAGDEISLLLNNAGGAFGAAPFADTDVADWERMYAVNVLGAARVTQALLPALERARGQIVFVTSTAADAAYEGGGGYCGVKAAEQHMARAMRLELVDRPIRIAEISPGLVRTDEFALVRYEGDAAKAAAVYAGVAQPLVAADVAECVAWVATRPPHVNIDRIVVRPQAQAANHKLHRVLPT